MYTENNIQDTHQGLEVQNDNSEIIRYNVPAMPVYTDKAMFSLDYGFSHESHWHNDIEFGLITQGELQFNINGNDINLKKGEGVFINSKQIHHAFSTGKCEWEGVCLIFSPLILCTNEHIERELINPVINNHNFPYAILSDKVEWCKEVFGIVCETHEIYANKKDTKTFPLEIQSLVCRLWGLLYNNMPQKNDSDDSCDYNIIILKKMISFIHSHYTQKISLSDICSAGSVCRSKCGILFKRYLHKTPIDYLTEHRLRKAAALLTDTSEPLNEVAVCAGFTGASYFAEIFRRHYNCSPTEYRNQIAG